MSFKQVYINRAAHFFPNSPVSNDEMESYLGMINGKPSKSKGVVLRNNGIKRRFYALEKGGKTTHNNAQITALAIRELFKKNPDELKSVQLLTCGTSSPDQMMPSHGIMVHGWLPETGAIEVVNPAGNCCAGMHALKYAYMAIKTGEVHKAVAAGSERTSGVLRSSTFEDEAQKLASLESNPYLSFEKDFLRWMLSDGAGAFLLTDKKNDDGVSVRIDWIESASYAHLVEPCMYMAADKLPDGTLQSYQEFSSEEIATRSILSMKQDVRLLDKYIVSLGYEALRDILERKKFDIKEVDYFLPHLSSEFFRKKIAATLEENGIGIAPEKWFVNLTQVGNIGAGSIYVMMEELMMSHHILRGGYLTM